MMRRRKFLLAASAGIGTFAGCTGSDSDGGGGGGDSGGSSRQSLLDQRRNVPEDENMGWSVNVNQQSTLSYSYTVRSGPEIDVFLTTPEEHDAYQNGNRFRVISSLSGAGGSDAPVVDSGTYHLVLDNTGAGEVSPPTNFDDDIADVEIQAYLEG